MVLQVISGFDPMDSTSARMEVPDYTAALTGEVKGMKIGVPREYFGEGVDGAVKEVLQRALQQFEALGAVVEETSLPHTEYALPAYYILAPAEASSNLARFDGVRYGLRDETADNLLDMYGSTRARGFGPEVKRRIMLGTYALSSGYYDAYYLKAMRVRRLVKEDFDRAFARYDVLVTPTAPTVAFRLNEKVDDVLAMYMSDIATIPVNLAGIPAVSIPCGFVQGLPVGMQVMGRPFGEADLLRAAYAFEQHTGIRALKPGLEVA
jgi:aspartyl-tRNA(Asn)/glutamyl-tRNA(Gln) amidotransferase subunit A